MAESVVSLKSLISKEMRSKWPVLWQKLKYRQKLYSKSSERELAIVHRFIDPRRVALDVGVHLGVYTRHFSRYASGVIGFEANPDSASFAKLTLGDIATIEWVALSSKSGTAVLRIPTQGTDEALPALGTLSETNELGGRTFHSVTVPTRRLDDFPLPPVGFIKMDVEGHEESVLDGGEQLLVRDRPAYMIEIEERHNPGGLGRIAKRFEALDYQALFYNGVNISRLSIADDTQSCGRRPASINNFFFVPKEQAATLLREFLAQ